MTTGVCPSCGHDEIKCKDSRPSSVDGVLRRRTYDCKACGYRFGTEEQIVKGEGSDVVLTERHMAQAFKAELQTTLDELIARYFAKNKRARARRHGPQLGAKRKAKVQP